MFRKFSYVFLGLMLAAQTISMEPTHFEEQYKTLGINLKDVFFPLDHPQWTPEKLPTDVHQKLHGWYFNALALDNPSSSQEILRKYRLLYSAGCLGHQLAAEQAGRMLLNPAYNNIIPLVTGYDMLEPEVAEWDVRRLNQAQTDNKELAQIIKKMEEFFGNEESGASLSVKENMLTIMQDLDSIEQTVEVQGVKIFLGEIQEQIIIQGKSFESEDFKPLKTLAFIKEQGVKLPLFDRLLGSEEDNYSQESIALKTSNFHKFLNSDFVQGYANTLNPIIYTISYHPEHLNEEVLATFKSEVQHCVNYY